MITDSKTEKIPKMKQHTSKYPLNSTQWHAALKRPIHTKIKEFKVTHRVRPKNTVHGGFPPLHLARSSSNVFPRETNTRARTRFDTEESSWIQQGVNRNVNRGRTGSTAYWHNYGNSSQEPHRLTQRKKSVEEGNIGIIPCRAGSPIYRRWHLAMLYHLSPARVRKSR